MAASGALPGGASGLMRPVSGMLVFGLCVGAFLLGRVTHQGSQLPEPTSALQQSAKSSSSSSASSAHQHHPGKHQERHLRQSEPGVVDALDPAQFESHMLETSGLLSVRPPLEPAASGEDFVRAIPFQILSWFPRIVVYPAFVDEARCKHIIKIANASMYPSGLAYRPGEKGDDQQQTRTSKGTFLSSQQDEAGVLAWVEQRIAAVTRVPVENGEAFNVLQYRNLQHYDSHMDSFDPKDFGPQPSQRVATVLVYLSDVEEGGETVFKKEGVNGPSRVIEDWRNCDDGSFKYRPRRGDAVLFWTVDPDRSINPRALHGGCPVVKGEKWVMTKWLRDRSDL